MAKTTIVDRQPEAETPPDTGCWVSPTCEACWLRECVLLLSVAERHKLADALRVVKVFAHPEALSR